MTTKGIENWSGLEMYYKTKNVGMVRRGSERRVELRIEEREKRKKRERGIEREKSELRNMYGEALAKAQWNVSRDKGCETGSKEEKEFDKRRRT